MILKQQHKNHRAFSAIAGLIIFGAAILVSSCKEDAYTPKPRGFYRIDMPDREYREFDAEFCPLTFTYPSYGTIERKTEYFNDAPDHPCWLNIDLPYFNGKIHMSYVEIDSGEKLERVINDGYKYAFKHSIKADFIDQTRINVDGLHGVLFDIGGNVASNVQFFATDSAEHYLRGSLYFNEQPNVDSLRPVIDFIRTDMLTLMRSINWK